LISDFNTHALALDNNGTLMTAKKTILSDFTATG
jgi:hypothetical protein